MSLEDAARDYHRKKRAFEASRDALAEEIVLAARAGRKQVDIVRLTGYTRERVRQIVDAATPKETT